MSELPETPEGVRDFMAGLAFGEDAPAPPRLEGEVMVPRSLRWPAELDQRVKAVAKARGISMSQLIREFAETELAALENDQPISRADALRALAGLRPLGPAA
jgi:predicted DNA-binding protein